MKTIITVILTIVVLILGFYIYISSGSYDISQLTPHNRLTKSIIQITTHNSIEKRLKGITVPDNLKDTSIIISGFKNYTEMCSGCHGAPGEPNDMVKGWYPKPPELYKHSEESDAKEFFWITKNGIKMTAMPAFKPIQTDEQIWAITAFVTQKLSKMTADEYKNWKSKHAINNVSH
jgi:mono/diheme cytochrome c family protein